MCSFLLFCVCFITCRGETAFVVLGVCLFTCFSMSVSVSQAHPRPSQPEAHLEQTSSECARHQENQRWEPGWTFQRALQVSSRGTGPSVYSVIQSIMYCTPIFHNNKTTDTDYVITASAVKSMLVRQRSDSFQSSCVSEIKASMLGCWVRASPKWQVFWDSLSWGSTGNLGQKGQRHPKLTDVCGQGKLACMVQPYIRAAKEQINTDGSHRAAQTALSATKEGGLVWLNYLLYPADTTMCLCFTRTTDCVCLFFFQRRQTFLFNNKYLQNWATYIN